MAELNIEEQSIDQSTDQGPKPKPKFDPKKSFAQVEENKPSFDPSKSFSAISEKKNLGETTGKPSAPTPLPLKEEKPLPNSINVTDNWHDNPYNKGKEKINKPHEAFDWKSRVIMNQPVDNVATGLMKQQKEMKISEATKEQKQVVKQVEERKQKAQQIKQKEESAQAKPTLTPEFDPLAFAMQDINESTGNKAFTKGEQPNLSNLDAFFGQDPYNATKYFKDRNDKINSQIREITQKIGQLNEQKREPSRGDIGVGIEKPKVAGKEYPEEEFGVKETTDVDKLWSEIADLNDYKNKLQAASNKIADLYTARMYPDASLKDKGIIKRKLIGDESVNDEIHYESKNIPLTQEQEYNNAQTGLQVEFERLDQEYKDKPRDDVYYEKMADLVDLDKKLINQFPEYKKNQIGLMIAQLASKDKNIDLHARMGIGEGLDEKSVKYLNEKYGISKDDLENIDNNDIPRESKGTDVLKGIYNVGSSIVQGAVRVGGTLAGLDSDKLTFANKKIQESGNKIFGENPYEKLSEPETIIDTNPNSQTYLQSIKNPKAGKYNYSVNNIGNALSEGIGGFVGFIGGVRLASMAGQGLKLISATAKGEDAAMTAHMIISGYEPHYQEAQRVMGNNAPEGSKALYATAMGYLDALAFKVLPKDKLFYGSKVQKQAANEFAATLANMDIKNIDRTLMEKAVTKYVKGVLATTEETAKITAGMSISQLAKGVVNAVIGEKGKESQYIAEAVQNVKQTMIDTPLSMALPLGFMEVIKYRNNSSLFKTNLYNAGVDPNKYTALIKQMEAKGQITPDEASKKLEVVGVMSDIVNSIPESNSSGNKLTPAQRSEYAYNRIKEIAQKAKAESVKGDEALSNFYKEEAKNLVKEREAILKEEPKEDFDHVGVTEISDKDIIPTFEKVSELIPEEDLSKAQDVINRVNNAENINENEIEAAKDILYKTFNAHPEAVHLIEPLIDKLSKYEFTTKTKTVETTEKVPVEGTYAAKTKLEVKPALESSEGSATTVVLPDGTTGTGTLKIKDGNYILEVEGQEPIVIGEKAITDRDLKLPSDVEPVKLDRNGNVKSVTFETKDGKRITIEDPEKALDLGIKLHMQEVGEIPDAAFEKAFEEVKKTVPVEELKFNPEPTKVEPAKEKQKEAPKPTEKKGKMKESLSAALGGEQKPVQTYTRENVQNIDESQYKGNKEKTKIVKSVKNIIKAVSSLVKATTKFDLSVNLHDSEKTYEDAVVNSGGTPQEAKTKGFYMSKDGNIHINMNRATSDTIFHEPFHPILDYLADKDESIIDDFHNQLSKLKGGQEIITKAENAYKGDPETTIKKEAITDFVAKVADGSFKIDQSNFQAVKNYVVNMLTKMGLYTGEPIENIKDLVKLAQNISAKFETGKAIEFKDGSEANSSQKVQFQSDFKHEETGIEWRYFKNSELFKNLVDKGYVTFDKNIDDFKGAVVLHSPDAAFSGKILKEGKLIADGKGGLYYPLVFHENGDFWAATARGANSLAKTLNAARAKSPDGKIRMVLISSPIDKLMSSSLNGIGLIDILTSKAFSEESGITQEQLRRAIVKGIKTTEKLKAENKDGMKPSQKPLPKITGNESLEDLQKSLKEFYPAENSDFPVRKSLNQNILEGISTYSSSKKVAKQLSNFLGEGSFNEKLKSTGGRLSKANLTQGFSNILAEPTLRGEQSGKMYAVIELSADVEPVKTSEHESYPFSLRSVDPNEKATVHILKQRDFWYNHVVDEKGQSIVNDKEKQSSILPSSAGISSVVELRPSKVEGVSNLAEKAKPQFAKEEKIEGTLDGKPTTFIKHPEDLEVVNGFYSPIEKRLIETKATNLSANKWKEIVGKGDEAKFTGVLGWLESLPPTQQVSKSEIQNWMKDNRIEISEVVKGEPTEEDIDTFLNDEAGEGYTREEARDYLKNDQDATKYPEYQLPGEKANYKEVLVTLPKKEAPGILQVMTSFDTLDYAKNTYGIKSNEYQRVKKDITTKLYDKLDSGTIKMVFDDYESQTTKFKSSHYDEPNILAHIRMNTRFVEKENQKYLNPKTYKPNFDSAFELIDEGDYYKVKKKGASSEYASSYSKKIMSENKMSENDLKEYLMDYNKLGKEHPDFKDNRKKLPVKVLHIEEFQSDWGQKGKKEGFDNKQLEAKRNELLDKMYVLELEHQSYTKRTKIANTGNVSDYKLESTNEKRQKEIEIEIGNLDAEVKKINAQTGIIPEAPFVTKTQDWTKLAWKVALKEAVKEGADKITWTTGEQQNDRYDLSKQVDYVDYWKNDNGTYGFSLPTEFTKPSELTASELESYLGKEVAKKIVEDTSNPTEDSPKRLQGEDLKVGGTGMKGFYGSPSEGKLGIVGEVAKSLFKQEPKTTELDTSPKLSSEAEKKMAAEGWTSGEPSKEGYTTQHSIDVTPEMKAQVEAGLPQFAKEGGISPEEEGKLKNWVEEQRQTGESDADISDVLKEYGYEENQVKSLLSGKPMTTGIKKAVVTGEEQPDTEMTKLANAVNDAFIEGKFGTDVLDNVMSKLQDTDTTNIYNKVKEKIKSGLLTPKDVIDRVLITKQGSEADQAVLMYDLADLKGKESSLMNEMINETDPKKQAELSRKLLDIQNDMQANSLANRYIGRTASNIFRLRQLWVNKEMDLATMEKQYMSSKGIKDLTPEQSKEIQSAYNKIREIKAKLDVSKSELDKSILENNRLKAENEKLKELKDLANAKEKKDSLYKSSEKVQRSAQRIKDAISRLIGLKNATSAAKEATKQQFAKEQKIDPRIAEEINKIAAEKFYQGATKLDVLVKEVLGDVKGVFPEWTEQDVRSHLFPNLKDANKYFTEEKDYTSSTDELKEKIDQYKKLQGEYAKSIYEWQKDRRSDLMDKRPFGEKLFDKIYQWQRFAVLTYPATFIKLAAVVGHNLLLKPIKFAYQKGLSNVGKLISKDFGNKMGIYGDPSLKALSKYYSEFIRNFSVANLKEQFSGVDTKEILYGDKFMYDEWAAGNGLLEMPGRSHGYIKSFVKNPEFVFAHEMLTGQYMTKMAEIGKQMEDVKNNIEDIFKNEKLLARAIDDLPNDLYDKISELTGENNSVGMAGAYSEKGDNVSKQMRDIITDEKIERLKEEYNNYDVTNEDVLMRLNKLSLEHGKDAILMGDNVVANKFREITKGSGFWSTALKTEAPIVKIPLNFINRAFLTKYGLMQAITGKSWGAESSKHPSVAKLIYKGTADLTEAQGQALSKALLYGSMGVSFFMLGYYNRKKVKLNEDGSIDFNGMNISKNLVHVPEFESFFSGVETANKFKDEKSKVNWIESFLLSDLETLKKNPFLSMLEYGLVGSMVNALTNKKMGDERKLKLLQDATTQKVINIAIPGFFKQPAQWLDTEEGPGLHPMGTPIKRKPEGDWSERFFQSLEMSIPGLRSKAPSGGGGMFTEAESKSFSEITSKGVNIPEIGAKNTYKVSTETGVMSDEDYAKFVPLVKKYAEKEYKTLMSEKFYIKEGRHRHKVIGSALAKEDLQNKVDAIHDKAIEDAKKKLKLVSKIERRVTKI